jgi:glyoxylase-like metal-dependent hydrolase (beta-lactamase superfamily II)
MEIASGIHDIPTALDRKLGSLAPKIYLLVGQKGALIDSAYGDEEAVNDVVSYASHAGCTNPSYIIITHAHPDHISGAAMLSRKTGAELVLHSAEKTDLPINQTVEEGDIISLEGIDIEVVHTPGHNPGHICLYIRKDKVMFTGDHVLADSTTALQPPWGDVAQYINSLKKLLSYDIDLMLPAHGPPVTEPKRRVNELIRHRLEREEQVIALLRQGKSMVTEIADVIYPRLTGFSYAVAKGQISAHLAKLEQEGMVSSRGEGKNTRYTMN